MYRVLDHLLSLLNPLLSFIRMSVVSSIFSAVHDFSLSPSVPSIPSSFLLFSFLLFPSFHRHLFPLFTIFVISLPLSNPLLPLILFSPLSIKTYIFFPTPLLTLSLFCFLSLSFLPKCPSRFRLPSFLPTFVLHVIAGGDVTRR